MMKLYESDFIVIRDETKCIRCKVWVRQCANGVHVMFSAISFEIKIGQGAKSGIGGHLPGEKVGEEVSKTRMIPIATDAIFPAPHHDIYSKEEQRKF